MLEKPAKFIHLHNHSDYSLLDGAQTVNVLVQTVVDLGMDAVALTEHGNMFSVLPFYKAAKKAGIKPIIGCEVYVAINSRFDKKPRAQGGWGNNHLVLLVQNETGYSNLMKLVTYGYLEGFYYRPRVDKDLLRNHSEGLICMSACLKGEVPQKLLQNDFEGAKAVAREYAEIFPDRYYLEIQDHGIPEEKTNIERIITLAKETGLPLVASNDAHYAKKEHSEAHDILICLGTGKDRDDPNRLRYSTSEFYLKTQEEMQTLFKDAPEAIENTRRIADSIDFEISMGEYHLPKYNIPVESHTKDPDAYLRDLCEKGLRTRYETITPEINDRLDHELDVIRKMGFAGYFLITEDFIRYAKDKHIPVGPGRGSAAGSIVSYALRITNINPLKYNLLFERFLNPERISMPDIDIDFCIERRGEVIDYIKEQYGEGSVTQIITFGKMKAKQVVRDVGRVMGYSFGDVDKIAKAIPTELNITLKDALKRNPDLKKMADGDYKELIEHALVLEGMNRHSSIHAAGVVIAPGHLTNYVPLYRSQQGDGTSQYDMKGLEELGLLKMDFLGLRNLTVIDKAVRLLRERGIDVNIDELPMDDSVVYKLFAKGQTIGVFQFESSGMREFLKKLNPTAIEDLIAMNALYRPGPMQNIDKFIARKNGKKAIEYIHKDLKSILQETYGIIVYQEQVMQIANKIAGFSLAEADLMRRAMGKKIKKLMDEISVKFIKGAVKNGIKEKKAKDIFALIDKFAQYGFNKSHSTAYAYVAYQTAWLKTHYPAEFMSANLTSEMTNIDRVVIMINECRKMKIEVNPPDINVSNVQFHPITEHVISYGLNAIKNVGTKALEKIIENREKDGKFKTIFEVCSRVDQRTVNKKVLESFVKAGAMDSLEGTRAEKFASIDDAIKYGQQIQNGSNTNQVDIFGQSTHDHELIKTPTLPNVNPWDEQESLDKEKEVLGLYVSGHPLLKYADDLEEFSNYDFSEKLKVSKEENVRIGGMISELRHHFDRKKKQMAFFKLDCLGGQVEILAFSDTFAKYKSLIEKDQIIFVTGKPTDSTDFSDLKLIAEEVVLLKNARTYFSKRINIRLHNTQTTDKEINQLFSIAEKHKGECGIVFHIPNGGKGQRVLAHNVRVASDKEFFTEIRNIFGKKNVWVDGSGQ